jgi:hypothetical protein
MAETEARCGPFYCGTQGADWRVANCDNCHMRGFHRGTVGKQEFEWRCEIQYAIDGAYMGDGTVSAVIGRRMGCPDNFAAYGWRCPEQIEIEPHAEYVKRFRPLLSRVSPIWMRLWRAARFAVKLWVPWWMPEEDVYGEADRISLLLAWEVAWGIHHDDTETVKCRKCGRGMPRV